MTPGFGGGALLVTGLLVAGGGELVVRGGGLVGCGGGPAVCGGGLVDCGGGLVVCGGGLVTFEGAPVTGGGELVTAGGALLRGGALDGGGAEPGGTALDGGGPEPGGAALDGGRREGGSCPGEPVLVGPERVGPEPVGPELVGPELVGPALVGGPEPAGGVATRTVTGAPNRSSVPAPGSVPVTRARSGGSPSPAYATASPASASRRLASPKVVPARGGTARRSVASKPESASPVVPTGRWIPRAASSTSTRAIRSSFREAGRTTTTSERS
ncbi:hypothetical protein GCM10010383_32410 [Streptomyces lomondensis]|uniref:Uncharacterized protein n=1 Tax=Streptomyces lomondensis TaxID=68229 RepID=A0ABQ2X4Z2_9ACTN|nr:hypothetical protein GCM10010383_32410 [Streptomyces lomondensis]